MFADVIRTNTSVGWIGQVAGQSLGLQIEQDGPTFLAPLAIAVTSWGLAMFFTGKRRMALPSILLLIAFVGSVFATAAFVVIAVPLTLGFSMLGMALAQLLFALTLLSLCLLDLRHAKILVEPWRT